LPSDVDAIALPYQAPQGRRVNVIDAYVTHGPDAGRLDYRRWAVLLKSRAKKPRTTPEERAAPHGLTTDAVGPIDAERLVAFLWQVAGRPADAVPTWRRARPLAIALDNYSVHTGQAAAARPQLAAANVELVYLARYCPAQSGIEPVWNDVKQHHIPIRSFERSEAVGAVAEAEQQEAIADVCAGTLHETTEGIPALLVEVDGVQVPHVDGWHEMKIGRVAPLGPESQTDPQTGRTTLCLGASLCGGGLDGTERTRFGRGCRCARSRPDGETQHGGSSSCVMAPSGSGPGRRPSSRVPGGR